MASTTERSRPSLKLGTHSTMRGIRFSLEERRRFRDFRERSGAHGALSGDDHLTRTWRVEAIDEIGGLAHTLPDAEVGAETGAEPPARAPAAQARRRVGREAGPRRRRRHAEETRGQTQTQRGRSDVRGAGI